MFPSFSSAPKVDKAVGNTEEPEYKLSENEKKRLFERQSPKQIPAKRPVLEYTIDRVGDRRFWELGFENKVDSYRRCTSSLGEYTLISHSKGLEPNTFIFSQPQKILRMEWPVLEPSVRVLKSAKSDGDEFIALGEFDEIPVIENLNSLTAPLNEEAWIELAKLTTEVDKKLFVLSRALSAFPKSHRIAIEYAKADSKNWNSLLGKFSHSVEFFLAYAGWLKLSSATVSDFNEAVESLFSQREGWSREDEIVFVLMMCDFWWEAGYSERAISLLEALIFSASHTNIIPTRPTITVSMKLVTNTDPLGMWIENEELMAESLWLPRDYTEPIEGDPNDDYDREVLPQDFEAFLIPLAANHLPVLVHKMLSFCHIQSQNNPLSQSIRLTLNQSIQSQSNRLSYAIWIVSVVVKSNPGFSGCLFELQMLGHGFAAAQAMARDEIRHNPDSIELWRGYLHLLEVADRAEYEATMVKLALKWPQAFASRLSAFYRNVGRIEMADRALCLAAGLVNDLNTPLTSLQCLKARSLVSDPPIFSNRKPRLVKKMETLMQLQKYDEVANVLCSHPNEPSLFPFLMLLLDHCPSWTLYFTKVVQEFRFSKALFIKVIERFRGIQPDSDLIELVNLMEEREIRLFNIL